MCVCVYVYIQEDYLPWLLDQLASIHTDSFVPFPPAPSKSCPLASSPTIGVHRRNQNLRKQPMIGVQILLLKVLPRAAQCSSPLLPMNGGIRCPQGLSVMVGASWCLWIRNLHLSGTYYTTQLWHPPSGNLYNLFVICLPLWEANTELEVSLW